MPAERTESLAAVLRTIRSHHGITQPMLTERVGWGRSVVATRIAELEAAGLVATAGVGPSTGGRAPRRLRLRAESGLIIGIGIGATRMEIGVADLSGRLLASTEEEIDVADGPAAVLSRAETVADELLSRSAAGRAVWGIGVGVPGPVEFATGLPVAPPIMPGWDGYRIRERLTGQYHAATWVDNDVNLLALGELHANPAAGAAKDFLYVKIGTGIGAGLISGGRLHRGTNGCAGDIGHVAAADTGGVICRCGNAGCLEAAAGGAALAREGRWLAETGGSPLMAEMLAATGKLRAVDVTAAAHQGDPAAQALLIRAGQLVGSTLATLVSFYNPALVVLGGEVSRTGDYVIAAIRESVQRRSLPLATRTLRIEPATLHEATGLTGAVHLVVDELFAPQRLARWLPHSTPAGRPELAAVS